MREFFRMNEQTKPNSDKPNNPNSNKPNKKDLKSTRKLEPKEGNHNKVSLLRSGSSCLDPCHQLFPPPPTSCSSKALRKAHASWFTSNCSFVGRGIEHWNLTSFKIRQRNEEKLFGKVSGDQMTRIFVCSMSAPSKPLSKCWHCSHASFFSASKSAMEICTPSSKAVLVANSFWIEFGVTIGSHHDTKRGHKDFVKQICKLQVYTCPNPSVGWPCKSKLHLDDQQNFQCSHWDARRNRAAQLLSMF